MISEVIDIWTFVHLCSFVFIFSTVEAIKSLDWKWHILAILVVGLGWEVAEHFMQRANPEQWGGVVEHWVNAWVTDLAADTLGGVAGVQIAKWSKGRFKKNK